MKTREELERVRLENLQARGNGKVAYENAVIPDAKPIRVGNAKAPVPDPFVGMNKTEKHRAEQLEAMKRRGEIVDWWYEAVTFRLANGVRYTPDFMVQEHDGSLRLEETKGWMRDDARIKTRDCVQDFPFPLVVLYPQKGGGWKIEQVSP